MTVSFKQCVESEPTSFFHLCRFPPMCKLQTETRFINESSRFIIMYIFATKLLDGGTKIMFSASAATSVVS